MTNILQATRHKELVSYNRTKLKLSIILSPAIMNSNWQRNDFQSKMAWQNFSKLTKNRKKYNNNHYHHYHHHHKKVNWTRKWLQSQINKLEAHLFPPNILNSGHNKIGWSHKLQQPPQTSSRIESQGKANKFITIYWLRKLNY